MADFSFKMVGFKLKKADFSLQTIILSFPSRAQRAKPTPPRTSNHFVPWKCHPSTAKCIWHPGKLQKCNKKPQKGASSKQGGHPPKRNWGASSQAEPGGIFPSSGGHPPKQGGHPPKQGGILLRRGASSQAGGYPPKQGGVSSQAGGHPKCFPEI